MEERSLLIKKYIFPAIVILLGLVLLNTALFSGTGSINQSGTFLLGAIVVLLMGVITVLYIKEIIGKNAHLIILFSLLISCLFLGYSTYSSISTTIAQIELKKEIDANIKQGLRDIEIVQLEYKKKYGWYSDNFNELKRFLAQDSVYSISTMGVVPDYKITSEHAEILGYDAILDYIQLESYDEKEALMCGLLTKDTSWENVFEKLFNSDSLDKRLYDFKLKNLDLVPMSDNKNFKMYAGILESSDDVSFETILYKNGAKYEFVSSYLIDYNGNDTAYYNKDIQGLIVKDSIPQLPQLDIGDNITAVDSTTYNRPSDFLEVLKNKRKDTIIFHVKRGKKNLKIKLTQKDIVSKPSRAFWTDFEDVLSYNLQPPLYNPDLFEPFYIGKNLISKDDEFSSPSLKIKEFKILAESRNMDSSIISFEIFKGDKIDYSNYNENSEDYFYLLSKLGTPVFTAFDPSPYDPLNERDTLTTGSLTEVKTSGNWK